MQSKKSATTYGCAALTLWAVQPLFVSEVEGFPIFETLSIMFFSSFIATAIRVSIQKKWKLIIKQPLFVWCFGVLCIAGADFSYMLGAFCAPIAHVEFIDYLWPCLIVVFIGFLPNEQFKWKHVVAAIIGFLSVIELVGNGEGLSGLKSEYMNGYLLAIYSVVVWGVYAIYSRTKPELPSEMMGMYCGVGAVICLILHLTLETTVMPSASHASLAILLGLCGAGLAYQLWDTGVKFGNAQWLSVCCYFARVVGLVLLVLFDKEPFSISLVIASAMAMSAVAISSMNDTWLQFVKKKLFAKKNTEEVLWQTSLP